MIILRQQMRSKPERTEDVWAALAAIVPGARATPGVITLDICFRSQDEAQLFERDFALL